MRLSTTKALYLKGLGKKYPSVHSVVSRTHILKIGRVICTLSHTSKKCSFPDRRDDYLLIVTGTPRSSKYFPFPVIRGKIYLLFIKNFRRFFRLKDYPHRQLRPQT